MILRRLHQLVICLGVNLLIACTSAPLTHDAVSAPTDVEQNSIITTHQMVAKRAAHTATRLADGRILLTGGFADGQQALASTEIFDPDTRTFRSASTMSAARQSHTATRLGDGTVLIAGGFNGDYLASAEIYDPTTEQFRATGMMSAGRGGHVAILLDDGSVLLIGGVGTGWTFLASAELYDPVTGTFTTAGEMSVPRESHTATLLTNGRVLIAGGHQGRRTNIEIFASAELYDPLTNSFTQTGPMTIKRHKHDATRLADGRVFISGGADERDAAGAYRSTEIYDPMSGVFSRAAPMHHARYKHTGTSLLLQDGQVLLVGGASEMELYNSLTDSFRTVERRPGTTRLFATATALSGGKVLFAGGYSTNIVVDARAWILTP